MPYFKILFTHMLFNFKLAHCSITLQQMEKALEGIYSFSRSFIMNRGKANAGLAYFKVLP
jgi:hypothetical protein